MNPVLPLRHCVPDVEPRVFGDRLYLYGSCDIDRERRFRESLQAGSQATAPKPLCWPDPGAWAGYCSKEFRLFSTVDLVHFEDHGLIMESDWTPAPQHLLFAPDCIEKNGQYYLYWCSPDGTDWVAKGPTPQGPFGDVQLVGGATAELDPAAFVDDDGSAYYYWGQFDCHGARMNPGLCSLDMATHRRSLLNEREHGFHEAASMRKINGVYYLVFADTSRGRATCLSYATSDSPLGPFTKRGVIIDNAGCDPEAWNNHGSLVEFRGQWYITYHRSSMCREGMRRLCMEKVTIRDDGMIDEVEMTTQGPHGPLDPEALLPATAACLLRGKARMDRSEAFLARWEHGAAAAYKYLGFGGQDECVVHCASLFEGCRLVLRLDDWRGEVLGEALVPPTGGWMTGGIDGFAPVRIPHRPLQGVHAIFLEATCQDLQFFNVKALQFLKA